MESGIVKACLDTHAVLWAIADDPRLGAGARALVVASNRSDLVVPDIVLLEVSFLLSKGRITGDDGPQALLSRISDNFRIVPLDPVIAHLATTLDLPHGDPFDRVIAATAKSLGIPLLSRDRQIAESGVVETIW